MNVVLSGDIDWLLCAAQSALAFRCAAVSGFFLPRGLSQPGPYSLLQCTLVPAVTGAVHAQKPHFLERASVVMVDHESGLTRAPTDNLEHHSLEFKDTPDTKTGAPKK